MKHIHNMSDSQFGSRPRRLIPDKHVLGIKYNTIEDSCMSQFIYYCCHKSRRYIVHPR